MSLSDYILIYDLEVSKNICLKESKVLLSFNLFKHDYRVFSRKYEELENRLKSEISICVRNELKIKINKMKEQLVVQKLKKLVDSMGLSKVLEEEDIGYFTDLFINQLLNQFNSEIEILDKFENPNEYLISYKINKNDKNLVEYCVKLELKKLKSNSKIELQEIVDKLLKVEKLILRKYLFLQFVNPKNIVFLFNDEIIFNEKNQLIKYKFKAAIVKEGTHVYSIIKRGDNDYNVLDETRNYGITKFECHQRIGLYLWVLIFEKL
jgi:hypothetical protein